jgi:hypothetical protein
VTCLPPRSRRDGRSLHCGFAAVTGAAVEHMGTGGSNFSFTFGACQAPQD